MEDTKRISPSSLGDFIECPFLYWKKHVDKSFIEEEHDYFVFGSALDALVTEGQQSFDEKFEVVPRKTKDAVKTQLTPAVFEGIMGAQRELLRQPLFSKFNTPGWEKQQFIECDSELEGKKIKFAGKLDYLNLDAKIVADLKTTASLSTFKSYNYQLQMAFYRKIVKMKYDTDVQVFLIVVDKSSKNRSHIYMCSEGYLVEGERKMQEAMAQLAECRRKNDWTLQFREDGQDGHMCDAYNQGCPHSIQKNITII